MNIAFRRPGDFPVIIGSDNLTLRRFGNLPHLRSPGRGNDLRFRLGLWLFVRDLICREKTLYRGLLFMILEGFPYRMKFLPLDRLSRCTGHNRLIFIFFRP